MTLDALPWIVLFLPLAAAVLITLFTQRSRELSAALSIGAVVAGFVLSVIFRGLVGWDPAVRESPVTWLSVGDFQVGFGLRFDPLSLAMLLLVTFVAGLIHIYSWGYMREDRSQPRYFAGLSLFTFSMLGIVLSSNFVQLFVFWELVGVSSYNLIGFWYERPAAADAGKKAFLANRLGDFGFLIGILLVWNRLGSLNFEVLQGNLSANPQALGTLATAAGLLIFCGAVGKSAQFPLHVWLPDAMEGPTPVSALIHAATMVAAGVFMLCRVAFLLNGPSLEVIAWIGGFTALLSAIIGIQQDDIKRILAYSTLSQLGYMVMAVGLRGPTPAMYHLSTHAFFKALLFLGAGSVIVAMHHEQDIWKMGGLRKKLPVTFWTFLAGTLALCGLPPFSGFYSKDSILAQAAQHSSGLLIVGIIVAALTPFYMFRLLCVAFLGAGKSEAAGHAQESPQVMLWPMRFLAALSIAGGFIGIEQIYNRQFKGEQVETAATFLREVIAPFIRTPVPAFAGLAAALVGLAAAWALYAKAAHDPLPARLGALSRWMRNRFYFDELYEATFIRLHDSLAAIAGWIDRWIIAGVAVRGAHGTTELVGRALRLFQTGNVQTYAFLFAIGVALVLYLVLLSQ
ncbi:MAG TPA: NADH-quinone oxidoreductase subunit L [Candidatus Acidoferrum sp.]|nr:NADH-quinone oxidoreductase subunit L [Candidatus Acidoferrum sp.]